MMKKDWFVDGWRRLNMHNVELRQAVREYHGCMRERVLSMKQVYDDRGYGAVRVRLRDEGGNLAYAIDGIDPDGGVSEIYGGPIEEMPGGERFFRYGEEVEPW